MERIGIYDPRNKAEEKQVSLQMDRVDYWLGVGAQPSDTVRALIKRERRKQPADAAAETAEAPAAASTGES